MIRSSLIVFHLSVIASGSTNFIPSFTHSHIHNHCFKKSNDIYSRNVINHNLHPIATCNRHYVNGLLPSDNTLFGLTYANIFTKKFSTTSSYTNIPDPSKADNISTKSPKKGRNRDAGMNEHFSIIDHFDIPKNGFSKNTIFQSMISSKTKLDSEDEQINSSRSRILDLTNNNVTLPVALICSLPEEYPSLSRARKACRNGSILIHRGPLQIDPITNETYFDPEKCKRGRADDRIYPTDVIAKQVRVSGAFYPGLNYAKPPFELPVVYEDDHFAIVNKPAGVVTYQHRKSGQPNRFSISGALPYALHPPSKNVSAILRKPAPVHRLDKPTSGLLLAAKTKPAMVALSWQFVERKVKKTYTAILNGIPDEPKEYQISINQAYSLGVDVPLSQNETKNHNYWQLIDSPLDGKHAITVWRAIQYAKSLKADQNYLTMVEVKPKTGRFHQIRRHMAWICERPLIGDKTYDTASESAIYFRQNGLFLCSNKIVLEHPFYNTEDGKLQWDQLIDDHNHNRIHNEYIEKGMLRLSDDGTTVEVHASIELPLKFRNLMKWEEERYERLNT